MRTCFQHSFSVGELRLGTTCDYTSRYPHFDASILDDYRPRLASREDLVRSELLHEYSHTSHTSGCTPSQQHNQRPLRSPKTMAVALALSALAQALRRLHVHPCDATCRCNRSRECGTGLLEHDHRGAGGRQVVKWNLAGLAQPLQRRAASKRYLWRRPWRVDVSGTVKIVDARNRLPSTLML